MKLKPLENRVVLEPVEEEKTTESGIVLPDTVEKDRPVKGKVVAVGPGRRSEKGERIPMSVKVGDMVLFKNYGPVEFEIDDKTYLVADEDDLIAIIDNKK